MKKAKKIVDTAISILTCKIDCLHYPIDIINGKNEFYICIINNNRHMNTEINFRSFSVLYSEPSNKAW